MAEPLDEPLTPDAPADSPEIPGTAVIEDPILGRSLSVYDGPAIDIAAELRTSYLGYAMSTIVSRALPDVRDGLKPVQRRILYAMRELGLSPNSRHLKSAKVVGECFVAGTRVATPNGLRRIEDLQVGDMVFTQTGIRPVTEAYILPEQPLLDVELGSGRNVFCTPGQQFKVHTDDLTTVWKRADELQAGDVIVTRSNTATRTIPTGDPVVGDITLDTDMAYLLGFFLADGWVDRDTKRGYHRISFAAVERPIIEHIQSILSHKFGVSPAITTRDNMYYLRVHDSALNKRILSAFDLYEKRAQTITVPEVLFAARPELLYAFVSGFADGDGSVHKSRNILVLTSIARPFLHDVSVLLFAHGVHSRLVPYDKVAGNTEYALEIGSRSLHVLGQHLTLSHPVKSERLAAILARGEYQPEKAANVPYLGSLLLQEFSDKHLGGGWYSDANGNKVRSGLKYADGTKIRYSADVSETFTVSMDALNTVGLLDKMNAIGSRYLPKIQEWQENGTAFHVVKAVRPSASEITYDIQVAEEHEFIANGMVVHNCMGNFHPHGDQALYGTMVRMAQPFSLRYPMVDGQGNFGSVDDDPPAAMRYTEARLTAIAMEMMEDIEKDTVNFVPTYDNERREPSVLPGKFPYLVCNGGSGIAVGMATNMPPHNLREICDACAFLLEHPEATIEQLMTYVPGPDFPTAGLILGSKGIKAAYHTGRGQVTMQAKTTIEPMDGGKSVIVISELPYQVIKKRLEEQIGDLVKEKKIDGITAVRDYSDKSGMRLVVELRRDVMPQKILNYLLKHTPLRLNFGVMMISLTEGGLSPKTLSLKTILQEYLDHRRDIITRRTKFELSRAKARAHILEGLQIAVQFLDEVIAIIRGSNSTEQARTRLIERFSFSGLQAEAILNMQLRQLTSLEQDKIEGEFKDLLKEIARFEDILMDPRRVNAMIKADLKYLKDKFGDDRRTRIHPSEAEEINLEDLIKEEEMLITITRDGYIKRLEYKEFRSQRRGGRGVTAGRTREEDNFEHLFRASTHDHILFFTDRGRVYRLKAFEVPQASRQAMGTAVINLIQIQPDEKITATVPIRDFRTAEGFLLMVTERGEIKRTAVAEYANLRANGLVTFDLEGEDRLKWVKHTPGTAEVILTTERGMAIRFPEDKVPSRGRAAGGVRGITLGGADDRVVAADVVIGDADAQELLVISELGLGKRTPLSAYRSQGRGGKGLITMNLTGERTGKCLVVAAVVSKESEPNLRLMIVTENGVMIRMKAEEIKTTINRSTSGVRLINLGEGDRVKNAEVIDVAKTTDDVDE